MQNFLLQVYLPYTEPTILIKVHCNESESYINHKTASIFGHAHPTHITNLHHKIYVTATNVKALHDWNKITSFTAHQDNLQAVMCKKLSFDN